jgi:hypothetical protein
MNFTVAGLTAAQAADTIDDLIELLHDTAFFYRFFE